MKDSIRCVEKIFPQAPVVYAHRSKEPCAVCDCGGVKTGFDSGGVIIESRR